MSTEKECSVLNDADEEKEVKDEKTGVSEEQELEELRAQVLQLLLELEEARDTSQKHEEGFLELQGETPEKHSNDLKVKFIIYFEDHFFCVCVILCESYNHYGHDYTTHPPLPSLSLSFSDHLK